MPTGTKEAATLTQGGSPFGTGWQPLWYRLVFPTGTNDFFLFFFPNLILFVIFITVYSFIIAKRTRALQYYWSYVFDFTEYLKLTKSEMRAYN